MTALRTPNQDDAAAQVAVLIETNLALVGHLVREVIGKVPGHVSRDDLTSAGMFALVLSARTFDAERGVPFARYATFRIRGALLDELRGMDWAVRSVRSLARAAESARSELMGALGRTPRPDEVAATMGISVAELDGLRADLERARTLSVQGFAPESGPGQVVESSPGPEASLLHREKLGYLHDAIEQLPDRLRFVVVGYFFEERTMADIGNALGITESRVSQLRLEAVHLLRDGMNSQLEAGAVSDPPNTARARARRDTYITAVATSGTVATRLARSTPRGEMRPLAPAGTRV